MKLVENIAKVELIENESGDKSIRAIASYVHTKNNNDLYLDGDVIEFKREVYPFLFNHGKSADDFLGETRTHYDSELDAYVSDINVYDNRPEIIKAIENGVYDSVSISYYITEYSFGDEDEIIVKHAIMNEVSLVSVGADPEAKLMNNELANERKAFIEAKNRLKEIKSYYE